MTCIITITYILWLIYLYINVYYYHYVFQIFSNIKYSIPLIKARQTGMVNHGLVYDKYNYIYIYILKIHYRREPWFIIVLFGYIIHRTHRDIYEVNVVISNWFWRSRVILKMINYYLVSIQYIMRGIYYSTPPAFTVTCWRE